MRTKNQSQNEITRVGVVGLGYVGLPLALLLVDKGFNVVGIDLNAEKIDHLSKGISYIDDIPNNEIVHAQKTGRFMITNSYHVVTTLDVIIICVPTPLTQFKTPDLSFIQDVANNLYPYLKIGQMVILESSTFPGTTKEVLKPILEKSKLEVGKDFSLCYSPERIDPGNKAFSAVEVPKVISGVTEKCTEKITNFYSQVFNHVVPVSSTEVAELCKLLENSFRYINISFINETAIICDEFNIDLWEVIAAASTKPYGYMSFYPGPGVGGHCIPVDPLYLSWKATQLGIQSNFIKLADQMNMDTMNYIVSRIERTFTPEGLQGKKILLYGVTYKKDISDYRESPSLYIMKKLLSMGADVQYHDPFVNSIKFKNNEYNSVELTKDQLAQFDCVVILIDHSSIPLDLIVENSSLIYDTRNVTKDYKNAKNIMRFGSGGQ